MMAYIGKTHGTESLHEGGMREVPRVARVTLGMLSCGGGVGYDGTFIMEHAFNCNKEDNDYITCYRNGGSVGEGAHILRVEKWWIRIIP